MANKTSNIQLPDGSTVSVPAWASESTMDQIAGFMAATNKVDQKFLTLMKGLGADVNSLQQSIQAVVQPIKQNSKNTAESKKDDVKLAKGITGTANSIMKASKFFGDTSTPLTGMVGATKSFTDGVQDAVPGLIGAISGGGESASRGLNALGSVADVAVDAGLAYLGWNAAKMEQFAEAQGKMIDAGAIFYQSSEQFDMLYSNSLAAGVTYNQMIDSMSQFSGAMTAIGGSVSGGVPQFVDMFDRLNTATDSLGDLGLSSKDMIGQYAEFIEYSRLTGTLNRQLADGGDALNRSFIDLQIESTGLANLTALSKSEAMQRKMAALTDPLVVLGTSKLEDGGLPGTADIVRSIAGSLGQVAPDAEVFQMILDGFAQEVGETTDPRNFDMAKRLDPAFRSALQKVSPELIGNINDMVRSGTATTEQASQMVFDSLADMDLNSIQSAGALSGSALKYITELQAAGYKYQRDFEAYNSLTAEEREQLNQETRDRLAESGRSVTMMNDATETFLGLQDAMTADMQSTYEMFDRVAGYMTEGADTLKRMLGIQDADDGFGEYSDSAYTQDNYEYEAFGTGAPVSSPSTSNSTGRIVDQELRDRAIAAQAELDAANVSRRSRRSMPADRRAELQATIDRDLEINNVENNQNNATVNVNTGSTEVEINNTVAAERAQMRGFNESGTRESEDFFSTANRGSNWDEFGRPTNRKLGGAVNANQPYIVGDELGLNSAELFVPDTSGSIVNNRDLNTMISNITSGQAGLTNNGSSAIIEELKQEYQSLIESKTQTVQTMSALRQAIQLFNDNKNRQTKIDIINSV